MGRRLALLIATYQYQDAGLRQLTSPAHDADALAAVLRDPAVAGFEVTTLTNEPHHRVGQAILDFYRGVRPDDLTFLYFTGHGLKDDGGRLYLAMTNTVRDNLLFTGLSAEEVDRAMRSCASTRMVLVLDCCYSGAFPTGRPAKGDATVHAIERFHGRGRAVLTSSDSTEYSFEGDHLTGEAVQSVFTRHLVAGLRDGSADLNGDGDITLDELYSYVHDKVVAEMPRQRPRKQDEVKGQLVIARNISWTPPPPSQVDHAPKAAPQRLAVYFVLVLVALVAIVVLVAADFAGVGQSGAAPSESAIPADTGPQPDTVLRGHSDRISGVAFSPDGQALASVGGPLTVRLWNVHTGQTTVTISPEVRGIFGVAFSPDGRIVATCGHGDNTIRLWETGTGKLVRTLSGHQRWVDTVAFSPDGKTLASGGWDLTARLWDVATGRQTAVLNGHTGEFPSTVYGVTFSPDGKVLATGGSDKTARLWDATTGQPLATLDDHELTVASLAFTPDGRTLVTAGNEHKVQLWDVTTRRPSGELATAHRPQSIAISRDGVLAVGESDRTVQLWDLTGNRLIRTFTHRQATQDARTVVALSPDGRTVATGDEYDGIVRLWTVTR
nr:caspase family protein [Kibdelosporangium sp. MJ126-NF4]CEL12944.1 High-affnity carbon uptake protein Hat/HatR [Kibdelosporangium sp. MJ126-NF4]CTQ98629.1 High-affnity carbon uptake protein Hat/HatR [Kibdelosporangium sp. MJ126-NF4]